MAIILSLKLSLPESGSLWESSCTCLGVSEVSRFTDVWSEFCGFGGAVGFGGTKYDDFDGGGGMKGFRTNDAGFGMVRGASGASDVLLKAAIRSRNDDGFSTFASSIGCFLEL
jgi:hypothetical protein